MSTLRKVLPQIADYPAHLESCWREHLAPRGDDAPTVVSTFAGAGGSSLGYSMAGFRELLAVEWDDNAVATFKANFPGVPVYHGDIAKLSVEQALSMSGLKPGELDVFDGSPPCQGFSTAGKRIMDDPRNQLFREYVRLLAGLRPKVFVMENVSGMVKGKMRLIFVEILRELKACGYVVSARLLNAMYFGVPQSRERMIFIGVRDDLGIAPTHPGAMVSPVPFGRASGGIPDYGKELPPFLVTMAKHQPAGAWSSNPDIWKRLRGGLGGSFSTKWAGADSVCGTIVKEWIAMCGIVHPGRKRYLNIEEVKRVGSFPDQFALVGKFDDGVRRIGNSVPPLFMRSIAQHIRREILDKVKR
jgi:DNA (cytosine-5)-methyltransferase 1